MKRSSPRKAPLLTLRHALAAQAQHSGIYLRTLAKWLFCALLTGGVCGLLGTAFHYSIRYATGLRADHGWLLYLLPLAGLVIVALYRLCGIAHDEGTNLVLNSIRTQNEIPLKMTPLIFIGTVLTHLCGGSAGREGAALQIGGSIGTALGRLVRLDEKDLHIITIAGMSALFCRPVRHPGDSGGLQHGGHLRGRRLLRGVFAQRRCGGSGKPDRSGLRHRADGLPAGSAAGGQPGLPGQARRCWRRRALLSRSCLSPVSTARRGSTGGFFRIPICASPPAAAWSFWRRCCAVSRITTAQEWNLLSGRSKAGRRIGTPSSSRSLFTALTIGAGFKGGEIVPTFFIGATFGCALGPVLGLDAGFAAAVGLVALFCAVVNCPLAALALAIELFGGGGLLLFAAACAVSYLLSGYYSLYSGQHIIYSKLRAEYINRTTH